MPPLIATAWPNADYLASVERAGARVLVLDPVRDDAQAVLASCDGLLLTGGDDVDPAHYGDSERHPTVGVSVERDAFELPLVRSALERNMPILAICRGIQVMNVAAGGTLIQDLPSALASGINHDVRTPKDALSHAVAVTAGTRLKALVAAELAPDGASLLVNSRHHQAVRAVAAGFVVSATAPDGVIEAIERPGAPFCVGVQWHPENFWRTGQFARLFRAFVEAAAGGGVRS